MKNAKHLIMLTFLFLLVSSTFALIVQASSWEVELTNQVTSDGSYDRQPCIIQDSSGKFFAFFASYSGPYNIRMCYSDDGVTWSSPVAITSAGDCLHPFAIQDQEGTYWLTYYRDDRGVYVTHSSNGVDWESPKQVTFYDSSARSWCRAPSIMQDRDGVYWLAYESSIHRSDILVRKSTDGLSWGSAVRVTPGTNMELRPCMIQDSNGIYRIVWCRTGSDITSWVSYSTDGASWSEPTQLVTGITTYEPALIQGLSGKYVFSWRDDSTVNSNIWIATSEDCVSVDTPVQLTSDSTFGPHLIQGIDGKYRMAYSEKGNNDDVWMMTLLLEGETVVSVDADFSVSQSTSYVNSPIDFDASSSSSENSSITSYSWDFGDGESVVLNMPTATHTYSSSGSYTVNLMVTDEQGHTDSMSFVVEILPQQDHSSPVTVDDYDGLWHTSDITITLTSSDQVSGVAETYYKINDGALMTVSATGNPVVVTEGASNTLEYWSVDYAGNEENHKQVTGIKLDKTAPTSAISLNASSESGGWFTSNVFASLSASDAVSGVNKIEYSFDNQEWNTYSIPFAVSDEGDSEIYYRAVDEAGNVEQTKTEATKLDKTAPVGYVVINENATYVDSVSVTLTLHAEDSVSGVSQMRFSNDGTTWTSWETYSTSKSWRLSSGGGTKTVFVQFKDNANLTSKSYKDTTVFDTTEPTADAGRDQTVTVGEPVTFSGRKSSDNSEIVSYIWNFGDGTTGEGETVAYEYYRPGEYTVTLTVQDIAGNIDEAKITVNVKQPEEETVFQIGTALGITAILATVGVVIWKNKNRILKNFM